MSITQKLKEKAEQTLQYISVTEIPEEVMAKVIKSEFKVDKRGNEALFITLETEDKKAIVQKYTPSTYKYLLQCIERCGGEEALKTDYYLWKKERVGRVINERLFPHKIKKK